MQRSVITTVLAAAVLLALLLPPGAAMKDPSAVYCHAMGYDECLVCILPDGTTSEVTHLMNLSFEETTCGDGSCGMPENVITCPADCKSGGWDNLCDGVRDGRCDPDCPDGKGDPDCVTAPDISRLLVYLVPVLIVLAIAVGTYLYRKKKKST